MHHKSGNCLICLIWGSRGRETRRPQMRLVGTAGSVGTKWGSWGRENHQPQMGLASVLGCGTRARGKRRTGREGGPWQDGPKGARRWRADEEIDNEMKMYERRV
jgi:hypothetical protein